MNITNTIKAPVTIPGGVTIPGKSTKFVEGWDRLKHSSRAVELLGRGTLVEEKKPEPVATIADYEGEQDENPNTKRKRFGRK